MLGTWHVETSKYNAVPIDSCGTLRFVAPRPQITAVRDLHPVTGAEAP